MEDGLDERDDRLLWLDVKTKFILKEEIDMDRRELLITGEITRKMYIKLDKQLRLLENLSKDPVTIIVNSPGGSVYDAFAIIDRLNSSTVNRIYTVARGQIASAALPIYLCGFRRTAGPHTSFMHHCMSYGLNAEKIPVHFNELAHTKTLENKFNKFIATRTTKPYSFWASKGKAEDFYFDFDKAVEFGVVHEAE